jgi:hypothetical protein
MATVTVTIQLRRTEGRHPVDYDDLTDAVVQALADLDPVDVDDVEGEPATYEITKVRHIPNTGEQETETTTPCARCGETITHMRSPIKQGRIKLYCSDACRQAAYRNRSRDTATFNRIMGTP